MKIKYIYLTDQSRQLAMKIDSILTSEKFILSGYHSGERLDSSLVSYRDFKSCPQQMFRESDCLVFIMATGIVVRVISNLLVDKFTDPAVLVVDELGINVISLLSGHMGGANNLCKIIADNIGANPVITTATDINGKGAFDMLVKKMGANVDNLRNMSLKINRSLLKGEDNYLYIDPDYRQYFNDSELGGFTLVDDLRKLSIMNENNMDDSKKLLDSSKKSIYDSKKMLDSIEKSTYDSKKLLDNSKKSTHDSKKYVRENIILISDKLDICEYARKNKLVVVIPRLNVLGVGCKKNTRPDLFESQILGYLRSLNIDIGSIRKLASIDIKKDEICIKNFCDKYLVESEFFSCERLAAYQDLYEKSEFVKKITGVYSVAQPACHILSKGKLFGNMFRDKGVTLVVGRL